MNSNSAQELARIRLQERGKNKIIGWAMTPQEALAFFKSHGKTVLTLFGYSGVQYQNTNGMLDIVDRILFQYSPDNTLVNIGATHVGLGAAYPLAKSRGFTTAGIVANLALEYPESISEAVDFVCFIEDEPWGGKLPNSDELSPTSQAMVLCSDILIGIGGGEITRDEMMYGKKLGKPVSFYPAESHHETTIRVAAKKGLPKPESFWGAANDAFEKKDSD